MAVVRDLGPVIIQKRGLVRLGDARKLLGLAEGDTLRMWVDEAGRLVLEPVDLIPRRERYLQTGEWPALLKESLDDLQSGRVERFDSADSIIRELHRADGG